MKRAIFGAAIVVLARLAWPTPPAVCEEKVDWTELWGALPRGGVLARTGPAGRTAGAVSTRSIASGDGSLDFVADRLSDLACGLTRQGHLPGHEEIDFALRLSSKGRVEVVEAGVPRSGGRPYSPGHRDAGGAVRLLSMKLFGIFPTVRLFGRRRERRTPGPPGRVESANPTTYQER